jgi:DNA-binding LytR/AlgR family response regulator
MTRALIADDEIHLAHYLRDQLLKLWPDLEIVSIARNGLEAAAQIAELQPDIAFLDIQMPGLTGLEVAAGIEGLTRVVFVTAYDEYALTAFDAEALDYVLKPVTAERLARTVERLQRALAPSDGAVSLDANDTDARLARALRALQSPATPAAAPLRWVRASQGELMHQVAVADVLFFHADDKYTCVRTAQAEYLIRTPIAELAAQLDGEQFWQVHRSTIVNLAHLAGTRRDDASRLFVRIAGFPDELPVSRAYVHLFKPM